MSTKEQLYRLFPEFSKEEIDNLWEISDGNFVQVGKDLRLLRGNANATDPPPRKEESNNNNESKPPEKEEHTPRGYQRELAAIGEKQNAIAVLPTGAGKTYIAILLAKKIHEKNPSKKILFIVDRVNLVYQQATAFEKFHSNLKIGKLHGDIVDKEFDSIKNCNIIVVIAQVVINLCEKKRFSLLDTSLLIFDEAHHTNKGHPYNRILQDYWFTLPPNKRPKIFGMTASPGGELTKADTIKKIGQLCLNMNSTICVPSDQKEFEQYVHKPELEVVKVEHSPMQDSLMNFFMDIVNQLINKLKELKFGDLPKSAELSVLVNHFKTIYEQDAGSVQQRVLIELIYDCCIAAMEMIDTGSGGVLQALNKALDKLKTKWGTLPASKEISSFLINMIEHSSIFRAIRDKKYSDVHELLVSPKTKALVQVLTQCVQENKQSDRLLFIVFVQTRKTAKFLKDFLLTTPLKSHITPEIYVGHGGKKKVDEENKNADK